MKSCPIGSEVNTFSLVHRRVCRASELATTTKIVAQISEGSRPGPEYGVRGLRQKSRVVSGNMFEISELINSRGVKKLKRGPGLLQGATLGMR
jgi:hypothetical protein